MIAFKPIDYPGQAHTSTAFKAARYSASFLRSLLTFMPNQVQPDRLDQSRLTPVTRQKVTAAENFGGGHMKNVHRPCAQLGAVIFCKLFSTRIDVIQRFGGTLPQTCANIGHQVLGHQVDGLVFQFSTELL